MNDFKLKQYNLFAEYYCKVIDTSKEESDFILINTEGWKNCYHKIIIIVFLNCSKKLHPRKYGGFYNNKYQFYKTIKLKSIIS